MYITAIFLAPLGGGERELVVAKDRKENQQILRKPEPGKKRQFLTQLCWFLFTQSEIEGDMDM